jgi:hypothetical protein
LRQVKAAVEDMIQVNINIVHNGNRISFTIPGELVIACLESDVQKKLGYVLDMGGVVD